MTLYAPPNDNCRVRPLSGYHFKVWVVNTLGKYIWFGEFQSLTLSIRNSTESYLTLGEKSPMYLDGEYQIAWVLEKGLTDGNFLDNIFGVSQIGPCINIPDSPRFYITYDSNAQVKYDNTITGEKFDYQVSQQYQQSLSNIEQAEGNVNQVQRNFRHQLQLCKVDNMSLALRAGKMVAAERWEGVAEGFRTFNGSVRQFKNQTQTNSSLNQNNRSDVIINDPNFNNLINR